MTKKERMEMKAYCADYFNVIAHPQAGYSSSYRDELAQKIAAIMVKEHFRAQGRKR